MKTSNKILLGLVAALALNVLTGMVFLRSSLTPAGIGNGETAIEAKGELKKLKLELSDFKKFSVGDNFKVELIQGEETFLEIEAAETIINYFEAKVEDRELTIDAKEGYTIIPSERIRVKLGFKNLEEIVAFGSSDFYASQTLNLERLELFVHGSSRVAFPVNTQRISFQITGSGRADITGKTNKLNINITGSGIIEAPELITQKADVRISGAGRANLNVVEFLDVVTTGSGFVYYQGNPRVEKRSTGASGVFKK